MLLLAALLLLAPGLRAGEIAAAVLDAAGKPVEGAVVFVYELPGKSFPPPEQPAVMDQVGKEFVPRVLPVLVGTKVRFPNKDNIHHHVYSFSKGKKFELPLYKDEPADPVTLEKEGVVKLGCNIHDWMLGYLLVLGNPYFAKTGPEGRAVLSGIPAGDYRLAAWSERLKGSVEETVQKVSVAETGASASFKLKLSPPRKSSRPAVVDY